MTLLVAVNILAAACGGGGGGSEPPPDNMATAVAAVSGNGQTGRVGEVLADPIQVAVTQDGQPAPDVTVNWSTTAIGGAMTPVSGPTDANGIASSAWTLGTTTGAQSARATVGGASGSPVTFTAIAATGPAAKLVKAGGDGQTGEINTQLALPVQAKVVDQFENPVSGTDVTWGATGATVSAPTVVSTDVGISQVSVTLGSTAGPITITAESDGLIGSPLTFNATAVEPTPVPSSINVTVRNDNFLSVRNGTQNPAVDSVTAGGTVTWTWAVAATNAHDVTSSGSPSFPSSQTRTQPFTYGPVTFTTPGTYNYYCTQHGVPGGGMWGRIVVQ